MSRNKRQSKEIPTSANNDLICEFILTSENPRVENFKILDDSIKRIKKEYKDKYSILILDSDKKSIRKLIDENQEILGALDPLTVKVIGKSPELSEASPILIKNRLCVWLDLDRLISPINFNEFFHADNNYPTNKEFCQVNWEGEKSSDFAGYIIHPDTSDFLVSQANLSGLSGADWYLRHLGLSKRFLTIKHPSAFSSTFTLSDWYLNTFVILKRWIDWNITSAFRKHSGTQSPALISNPPLGRILFFIIALSCIVLLPLISYNAGISGDEEKHYAQAGKVYNYFVTDGKDTTSLTDEKYKLNYYGQSFDLFTYYIIKKFNIQEIYEARHVMNGIVGGFAILCSGLLARILFGNIAGIFTMILLFFSPGFLGHAMNNPLDVPFAFGYIFTLLQLIRFLKRLPVINYGIAFWITLGIAFTISIRIGGLILIPYIFMFSGLYLLVAPMPWKNFSPNWFKLASRGLLILISIAVAAYFISILPWPYARQNPLKNPFESMKMMANISVALRVLFDGKIFWSNSLPASYIPKNILFSVPLIILAGFISSILFIRNKNKTFWIFFLLFVSIFPVVYVIYKESNVYGAWRHLLFIYPPMVVLAGMSLQSFFNLSKNSYIRYGVLLIFAGTMFNPVSHIIRNYPNQYIYFNELAGGVKRAYKKYETDYYMVSLKPGTDWIKENILENSVAGSEHPIKIISNAPSDIMNYYFREYKDKVKLPYTRYYDRGLYDWDYAIFFCNYIDPYQITHNIWPPKNTIYTVNLDGVKICAVVKRENKDDYKGFELMNNAMKNRFKADLDESVRLMENAIQYDNHNEVTYLNLAQAYILREQFEIARKILNELLGFYPNYEKALNLIGYSYLNEGEINHDKVRIERAIAIFNDVVRINYKFAGAYHNLGLASLIKGEDEKAYSYFQKSVDNNPAAKDSYYLMANIVEKRGNPQQARKIREYANRL